MCWSNLALNLFTEIALKLFQVVAILLVKNRFIVLQYLHSSLSKTNITTKVAKMHLSLRFSDAM